jgi:glucose/arabinose dehydrogenase
MSIRHSSSAPVAVMATLFAVAISAQQPPAPPRDTLADGPQIFDSSTRGPSGRPIAGLKFRVVPMKGLSHPYALAFLPDGNILITERAGRLRIVRSGVLDPQAIAGMPAATSSTSSGPARTTAGR